MSIACTEFGRGVAVATEVFGHTAGAWLPACVAVPVVPQCIAVAPWADVAAHVAAVPGMEVAAGAAATEACDLAADAWGRAAEQWNAAVSDWKAEWNGLEQCLASSSPDVLAGCLAPLGL